jgi:hypothetical protein
MLMKHVAPGRSFYLTGVNNMGYVKLAYNTMLVKTKPNSIIAVTCPTDDSHTLFYNAVRIDNGKLVHICQEQSVQPM